MVIALLDAEHVMHTQVTPWLARELDNGWASCPVPQNGVLRILSKPAYPNHRSLAGVAERLAQACSHPSHQFWSGGVSLLNPAGVNWRQLLGARQVTDAYLLAAAISEGGRFVSLDQRIPTDLVSQARPNQLAVIGAL